MIQSSIDVTITRREQPWTLADIERKRAAFRELFEDDSALYVRGDFRTLDSELVFFTDWKEADLRAAAAHGWLEAQVDGQFMRLDVPWPFDIRLIAQSRG